MRAGQPRTCSSNRRAQHIQRHEQERLSRRIPTAPATIGALHERKGSRCRLSSKFDKLLRLRCALHGGAVCTHHGARRLVGNLCVDHIRNALRKQGEPRRQHEEQTCRAPSITRLGRSSVHDTCNLMAGSRA